MRAASLVMLLCLPAGVPGAEPPVNLTPGAKARPGLLTDDFEMLHDNGGRVTRSGAIQTGTHRFYAVRKGKPDLLTQTAQFTQVWKEENGQWRLARVLSYDHQLAGQTGGDQ